MQDRVPLYPGRVKLTPVSGQANTYDMVRADQPQQVGTPLSKAHLLTDTTAALIGSLQGRTDPVTPDAALALLGNRNLWGHGNLLDNWDFRDPVNTQGQSTYTAKWAPCIDGWRLGDLLSSVTIDSDGLLMTGSGEDIYRSYIYKFFRGLRPGTYTYSLLFDGNTGTVALTTTLTDYGIVPAVISQANSGLLTMTFTTPYRFSGGDMYAIRINATAALRPIAAKFELGDHQTLAHKDASGNWVLNDAGNYLEELAKAKAEITGARIQTGSYVGTGTYGASNPNSLTFDFVPKLFYLQAGTTFGGYSQYGYVGMGDAKGSAVLWIPGVTTISYGFAEGSWNQTTRATVSFSGRTLSWYGTDVYTQANKSDTTYYWVAIG